MKRPLNYGLIKKNEILQNESCIQKNDFFALNLCFKKACSIIIIFQSTEFTTKPPLKNKKTHKINKETNEVIGDKAKLKKKGETKVIKESEPSEKDHGI